MGQERKRYTIVLWGFGWVGLFSYKLCWVELMGMGEESSGGGKIFEGCVYVIVHLQNVFNDCREFWTVF